MVRITTWNVNGIRNPFGYKPWSNHRTFNAMFDILQADIVIMQELKIQRKDLTDDMVLVPGFDCYFSLPKHKKGTSPSTAHMHVDYVLTGLGYSGVGIYTRQSLCAPVRAEEGLMGVLCPPNSSIPYRELPEPAAIGGYPTPSQVAGIGDVDPAALDAEGRCLVLEFPAFLLFGVYCPANSNGLRDDFRLGFLKMLDARIRNLTAMGKHIILAGDLNVSRDLIDTAKAEDNMRAEGMTHDEYLSTPNRRIFNQLLLNAKVPGGRDEGREEPVLYDLCREFHPNRQGMFTHWEQKINARPGNFGSRIDFVLCSIAIKDWFKESNIQEGLMGSDHCPVYAVIKDKLPSNCNPVAESAGQEGEQHVLDLMNPIGMFQNGLRLREYDAVKDIPLLSGRLLTEFTKRRSIREMFSKKPVPAKPTSEICPTPLLWTASSVDLPSTTATDTGKEDKALPASPLDSPRKRRASASASPSKPVKRKKSGNAVIGFNVAKGQQSLKGFFQARDMSADYSPTKGQATPSFSLTPTNTTAEHPYQSATSASSGSLSARPPDTQDAYDSDPLATQESSRESWSKLFSKKSTPRCEHGELCITLTTKKPGMNRGRQFYMCPRPIGPSGQKETGTQWRCGTFIWRSDWKGS